MNNNILKKINSIVQHKDDEEEKYYYEKYNSIFKETFKILRKKKILLYGGTAINELLPSKLQFYKSTALPDIDVLTIDGEKLAKNIVKYFKKKGYNNISTTHSEALHPGTYKVYVDSLQILDITNVPKNVYKRLAENSVVSSHLKLKIVDIQFLRMTLHLILAKGDATTVHRWGKVLERLTLFYKQYPPKLCKKTSNMQNNADTNDIFPEDLITNIYTILKDSDYILFGIHEIELLLDRNINSNVIQSPIQVLVKTSKLEDITTSIINKINADSNIYKKYLKVSQVYKEDTLIPTHIFIYYKQKPIMAIFNADVCYGFNLYNGIKIASIHTIIYMYLCMILTPYKHFHDVNSLECLVNMLTLKQMKMRSTKKKLYQDIVSQCYGENIGLVTMRKNRLLRLARK